MKVLIIFVTLFSISMCALYNPQRTYHHPVGNKAVLKSVGDLFDRLHLHVKRCFSLMDDTSCINNLIPGASSDEQWLGPGKRCANFMDESCANGDINGAGSDEDWINGGGSPGKRCANFMDESCANGDINGAGSDEDWINGDNSPGKRQLPPRFG